MHLAEWYESRYWLAAGWTMFHFVWIGAAVWLAGLALRSTLSRTRPNVQYGVALGLFLAVAGVPGALFVAGLDAADELRAAATERASAHPRSSVAEADQRSRGERARGPGGAHATSDERAASDRLAFHVPREVLRWSCRWSPWLWLAGTPLMLLILACGATGGERLRRTARPVADGDLAATCRRLQAALRIGRHVAVALSDRVAVPMLVGILRPMILFPPAILTGCSPDQIEMILIHELAHVRRRDNLVNLVQRLIEALLFFHPVVWWLSRWVRLERERCCDEIVVAHTRSPQVYAETLAALAAPELSLRHPAVALTDGHLVLRIRHILNLEKEEAMSVSRKAFLTLAILLIAGIVSGALFVRRSGAGGMLFAQSLPAAERQDAGQNGPAEASGRVKTLDVLSIQLVNDIRRRDGLLKPGDEVLIRGANLLPPELPGSAEDEFKQINELFVVQPDGTVDLGPIYGSVAVAEMTIKAAREALIKHLREEARLAQPKIAISLPTVEAKRRLSGARLIRPDGTVSLGDYGSVYVNDMTLEEVKAVVEGHLAEFIDRPEVKVTLARARGK